jgi:hypothetical protein
VLSTHGVCGVRGPVTILGLLVTTGGR